jgi:hypothetical protein
MKGIGIPARTPGMTHHNRLFSRVSIAWILIQAAADDKQPVEPLETSKFTPF